jgi:hypothetical protein
MANLKLRIELNKGRKGIPLEKLEQAIRQIRGFLTLFAEDLDVPRPNLWNGIDFRNGSVAYTAEHQGEVPPPLVARFDEGVINLARNERPANVRPVTIAQFHTIVEPLPSDDHIRLGLFPLEGKRMKWLKVSRSSLNLPTGIVLAERKSIGSAQGVIHSLFKEGKEPFFQLRDQYTGQLVKCTYRPEEEYEAIVEALRVPERVVHVHGLIREVAGQEKRIALIEVDRILLADPFSFEDVEKFISGKPQ